jgi:hypothetical protein
MATTTNPLYRRPTNTPADPCTPCKVCGGLQCLCRPRFFAGQLLTEQDLNRLDRYIVNKNKLHNRYLHGWGVACGLEVVCHPCGNYVMVRPGYALSPCGDDIVVCEEETVDVCKLIEACCTPADDPCNPPRPRPANCDDLEQEWILAICYNERPSREEPVLQADPCRTTKSCGCGCKGSGSGTHAAGSSGSCGCHSKQQPATPKRTPATPAACEPTMICEGYTFRAYLAPRADPVPQPPPAGGTTVPTPVPVTNSSAGELMTRIQRCLAELYDAVPTAPPAGSTVEQIRRWCCDVRSALLSLSATHSGVNCELLESLSGLCAAPAAGIPPAQYQAQITSVLSRILRHYMQQCICSALLPPCPDAPDNCVPLATIRVRRQPCSIVRICNLEGRKFLTTFPNLQYWLSVFPYGRQLRRALARLCCTERETSVNDQPGIAAGARMVDTTSLRNRRAPASQTVATVMESMRRSGGMTTMDAASFDILGLNTEAGQPFLSRAQAQDLVGSLLTEELLAPILGDAVPAGAGAALFDAGRLDSARLTEELTRRNEEMDQVRAQVAELQKLVRTQQMTIEGLASRVGQQKEK